MAYVNPYSIGETSFWANIAGLDTSYTGTPRTCKWYYNGTLRGTVTISNGVASGGDIQFTGLSPSTTYSLRAEITYSGGSTTLTANVKTEAAANVRPNDWSWSSTISSGSTLRITANEWNNFCNRINEFREYKDMSDYSFSSVSSGSVISASIVNQAYNAISGISGRGGLPSQASRGEAISAYFFNQLRNALNAIP